MEYHSLFHPYLVVLNVTLFVLLGSCPPAAVAQSQESWISTKAIQGLPISGKAWEKVQADANCNWGEADLTSNNTLHDVHTLAGAYVAVRLGDDKMRQKVIQGLQSAMKSQLSTALQASRGLQTYIIAADIIGYRTPEFKAWVRKTINAKIRGHSCKGVIGTAKCAPNNWGGHARESLAAAALYLEDKQMTMEIVIAHKEFIGLGGSKTMIYQKTNWHANFKKPKGINPAGSQINGIAVSGVLPEDWRRGDQFKWPPVKTGYMWEGMQGFVVTAVLLHRAKLVAFDSADDAVVRSMNMLYGLEEASGNRPLFQMPAEGDDTWIPWVVNYYAEEKFPVTPARSGKNMGYTDWTHATSPEKREKK